MQRFKQTCRKASKANGMCNEISTCTEMKSRAPPWMADEALIPIAKQ